MSAPPTKPNAAASKPAVRNRIKFQRNRDQYRTAPISGETTFLPVAGQGVTN